MGLQEKYAGVATETSGGGLAVVNNISHDQQTVINKSISALRWQPPHDLHSKVIQQPFVVHYQAELTQPLFLCRRDWVVR